MREKLEAGKPARNCADSGILGSFPFTLAHATANGRLQPYIGVVVTVALWNIQIWFEKTSTIATPVSVVSNA